MKTFIFHTEYSYYACVAATLEEARAKIKAEFDAEVGEPNAVLSEGDCVEVEHANE